MRSSVGVIHDAGGFPSFLLCSFRLSHLLPPNPMMDRISVPSNCSLDADNVFGPVVPLGCRNGFDFTLLFEQSILGILPAAVFLLASPLRVGYLIKKDARTQRNSPRFVKLVRHFITKTTTLIWNSYE